MLMAGTDGIQYSFLLKGHEDLRQDERVMQLFGLVNELLKGGDQIDIETRRLDLSIRRYSVVPLSHDAGLVGVSSCFVHVLHIVSFWMDSNSLPTSFTFSIPWQHRNHASVGTKLRYASVSDQNIQRRQRHSCHHGAQFDDPHGLPKPSSSRC